MMGSEKKSTHAINVEPHDISLLAMTDEEEQTIYAFAVEQGIRRYEGRFRKPEQIPPHRALDARNVRLIQQQSFNDVEERRQATNEYLKKIVTGFWFIRTGRSQFRKDIAASTQFITEEPVRELSAYLLSQREVKSETSARYRTHHASDEKNSFEERGQALDNVKEKEKEKEKEVFNSSCQFSFSGSFFSEKERLTTRGERYSKRKEGDRPPSTQTKTNDRLLNGDRSYGVRSLPVQSERVYHEEIDGIIRFGLHASVTRKEMIARAKGEMPDCPIGSAPDVQLSQSNH